MKTVYFAGGCFWCIASYFYDIEGVIEVVSGYSGGEEINPTYEEVKSQTTGHRETIKIVYDETKITFERLFNIFYGAVDPFDNEGQFIDKGHSYTLAVYYTNEEEFGYVRRFIKDMENLHHKTIYISLEPFKAFYKAEEYHQDYSKKNPDKFEQELIESGRKKI